MKSNTRKFDLVSRYGGEEFCLVLPGQTTDEAFTVAERIRLRIKDESIKRFENAPRVTASLGIASIFDKPKNPEALNNWRIKFQEDPTAVLILMGNDFISYLDKIKDTPFDDKFDNEIDYLFMAPPKIKNFVRIFGTINSMPFRPLTSLGRIPKFAKLEFKASSNSFTPQIIAVKNRGKNKLLFIFLFSFSNDILCATLVKTC